MFNNMLASAFEKHPPYGEIEGHLTALWAQATLHLQGVSVIGLQTIGAVGSGKPVEESSFALN